MAKEATTPIRKQYLSVKKNYQDAILFFRLGDFYETFDDDAQTTSKELDIVLTSRKVGKNQRVPMAGIPFHAADNYISRLIEKGYHVAICEQIGEQPQKGLFPREVVRVITPGTIIEPGLIRSDKNNYLLSFCILENKTGLAYMDISTGDAGVTEFDDDNSKNRLHSEISRISPTEIIHMESQQLNSNALSHETVIDPWKFEFATSKEIICSTYNVSTIDGFGLKHTQAAVCALGGLLRYLKDTDNAGALQYQSPGFYSTEDFMVLDQSTRRNLELTRTLRGTSDSGSLLWVIDKTKSALGKRRIIQWINQPLTNLDQIDTRLNSVSFFYNNGLLRIELQEVLKKIADIERINSRIGSNHATPRDLVSLRTTLQLIPELFNTIKKEKSHFIKEIQEIDCCNECLVLLEQSISDDPPATLQHTGIIKNGYSKSLDDVIEASSHARDWIANLERQEKTKHQIKNLKVGYNKVFGYYIEISNSNLDRIPEDYIRKQTLVNAERFITPELKEFEAIVLNADEQIRILENQIFSDICTKITRYSDQLLKLAKFISEIDVYMSFAQTASENNYCKPHLTNETLIDIKGGRHPVVEHTLQIGQFISNDSQIDQNDLIHILTGPNMSGKSTYLRQVALIVLLAQIGSYVPAESATIGLVDRIFTRIGAQDEIHAGQSTFMVEMVEAANILNNATNKSLLILDEIGRGTSTYDGLSIAWAVIEYLHNHPKLRARTLFATHYHELTVLPDFLPQVSNFNIAVSESNRDVIFLHKIVKGGSDKSYGIHVAQLAGIPNPVINRASDLLNQFESESTQQFKKSGHEISDQLPLFNPENPLLDALDAIDTDALSPIEALNLLYKWKKDFGNN